MFGGCMNRTQAVRSASSHLYCSCQSAPAILADWSLFVERYFLSLQSEQYLVYLLQLLYTIEARELILIRTLENLLCANISASQLDIHRLCNSRPVALG